MERNLAYWKGRMADLEELIAEETDRERIREYLVSWSRAYVEARILEAHLLTSGS